MLAIQITKDSGSRYFQLAKICDMAELLRVYPRLDLAQVLRQARRLGGERMLLYSLRLANNLLGTVLPQEIVSRDEISSGYRWACGVRSAAAF